MTTCLRLLLALLLIGSTPARAQGPLGIAYVAAPEAASGTCTGANPDEAFACARRACAKGGVQPGQCLRVAWCFPAGWSTDVFMQDNNGLHGHEFSCGWPSRELAEAAAALRCDKSKRERVAFCEVVRVLGPDGGEVRR